MKRPFIALFMAIAGFVLSVQAQTGKVIGENYITGDSIMVREYIFPGHIYDYRVDTACRRLFASLRERNRKGNRWTTAGTLVAYDLAGHKVNWTKNITYSEQGLMHAGELVTVSNNNYQPVCLNAVTGRPECTLANPVFCLNGELRRGFGMNSPRNKIQCMDMCGGSVLWEKRLEGAYGIDGVRFLNDSTILISAAGLHAFDLRHGGGWDYNAKTGIKDYTEAAVVSALGVVAAATLGVGVMAYGYNILQGLSSNTLIADNDIYFSDMNRLSCFGTDGTVEWYRTFDKNVLSKSYLSLRGDTLVMVNLGYGYYNGK